jgi:UDP-N-acetylglucosamine 4-epimerase
MTTYEATLSAITSKPKRWLVTGGAGFIGSHLVENLLKLGQDVVALDNFSTGKAENLEQIRRHVGAESWSRLRFIEGDIRYRTTCDHACKDVNIVLHQAALGSVVRSIENPSETDSTNIGGFLNMMLAARDAKVGRFVYAASSATYGDSPRLPKIESEIGRPLSPYALTKYVNELYADVFGRCYGTEAIGLRYFNVFGPRQDPDGAYAAVIPKWIAALLRNERVEINGDGTTSRDFCFVDNVVQANLLAATVDDPQAVNQVYNVACGEKTSLNQLFATLRQQLATYNPAILDSSPVYCDFRAGDVKFSLADISKARNLLGYAPAWNVQHGLGNALDWYVKALAPANPKAFRKDRAAQQSVLQTA